MMKKGEKGYREIIADFLKEEGPSTLQEIYRVVKEKKSDRSTHWEAIVRNKLYYSREFVKVGNEWKLK